jgi:hypothetical protein
MTSEEIDGVIDRLEGVISHAEAIGSATRTIDLERQCLTALRELRRDGERIEWLDNAVSSFGGSHVLLEADLTLKLSRDEHARMLALKLDRMDIRAAIDELRAARTSGREEDGS